MKIRLSISTKITFIVLFYIIITGIFIYFTVSREIIVGSTEYTIRNYKNIVMNISNEILDNNLLENPEFLESLLMEIKKKYSQVNDIFVVKNMIVIASTTEENIGKKIGGEDAKGIDIKKSIKNKISIGDVEKHTKEGKVPRYSYIYPIIKNGEVKGVIVSKFSLEKEFHSIEHTQKALIKYILISMMLFFPLFFFLLKLFIINPIRKLVKISEKLSRGNFNIKISSKRNDEIGVFAKTFLKMANNLKAGYERYLSPQVVESLSKGKGVLENFAVKKRASIMFCDLENFTSFSQEATPEILTRFLNFYFKNMTEIIFKYNGTIDKFLGDGIMAVFGVPVEFANFETEAVSAAIEMQKYFLQNFKSWISKSDFKNDFSTSLRIGIATGEVFWGNIGYEKRTEFTSIGKVVNLASRLEKANKLVGSNILIDLNTFKKIDNSSIKSIFNKKSSISIKGFSNSIDAFGTYIE